MYKTDIRNLTLGELEGTYTTPIRDVGYVATFYVGIEVIVSINQGLAFDDDPAMKFNSDPSIFL